MSSRTRQRYYYERGGGSYVPATLPGIKLALEAGRGGMLLDQSGNASNFTATGSPVVTAGTGPNGSSAMSFDGSTQYLSLAKSIALGPSLTWITIAKVSSATIANAGVFSAAGPSENDYSGASGTFYGTGYNAGAPTGLDAYVSAFSAGALTLGMDAYHCVSVDVDAVTKSTVVRADGVTKATFTAGADSITPTTWSVGSRVAPSAGVNKLTGLVAAVYVYGTKLSASDRAKLAADLLSRFGVTL